VKKVKTVRDAKGRDIPTNKIKRVDLKRDQLVKGSFAKAGKVWLKMMGLKSEILEKSSDLMKLSGATGDVQDLGNMTLTSLDGNMKLVFQANDVVEFDEKLKVAKQKIDKCLQEWSKNSNTNLQVLVMDAFNVDKKGNINKNQILSLTKLKIEEPLWLEAIKLILDSINVTARRKYLMLMFRNSSKEQWQRMNLNFSSM
jgi:hypothetical protein